MKPSQYMKLVKDVFSVEPGASLLKALEEELNRNLFDADPYIHAFNSGQNELIKRMRLAVESPNTQIKLFRQHENTQEDEI